MENTGKYKIIGYLYKHKNYPDEYGALPLTEGDKKAGWSEIPLCSIDAIKESQEKSK